jgi:hypothetical protein
MKGAIAIAAAAAAVASSPPVGGGHYAGTDHFKASYPVKRTVTIAVTQNRANFASARFDFALGGQGGLGSCAGPAYVTVSRTKARQITRSGTFDLHGRFTFKVPTPYGPQKYPTTVTIKGAFSDAGKRVAGTLVETAVGRGLTCRSGVVRFTATLQVKH